MSRRPPSVSGINSLTTSSQIKRFKSDVSSSTTFPRDIFQLFDQPKMDTSLNPQKLNSSTKKPLVNKGRLVKINSSNISSVRPSSQTTADEQLWLKLFEPTTKDTLAIHSKKIKEVEDKLRSCLIQTKKCRIILCTGPCGCGKSICIRLIASSLDANIIDWETSTTSTLTTTIEDKDRTKDWESQKLLFRSFLFQSTRYLSSSVGNSLLFESDIQKNLRTNEQLPKTSHKYQIVLIEDLPNAFYTDVAAFHSILRDVNHLARSPIVFVLTDNCSFSTLNNPQLLFPQTIIDELRIEQISFNPIAPTLMKKALESVLLQASKLNLSPPSKECIPELIITSNGDLRSAINSLQFSSNNIVQLKSNGQSKLKSTVKSKDSSLSLFRALGRILYKKDGEDDLNESSSESTLHATPSVRQPPEDLIDQCHISPMGFIGFLFENYIDFYSSIDDVGNVCDYLSFSDQILTEWSTRSILTSVTSSMACRAVRYFNSKPIRRGFKPIRKPQDKTVYLKAQKSRTMLMSNKLSYGCSTEEYFTVLLPFQARLLTTNQRSSNLSARHITDVGIISKRGKWQSCGSVTERDGSGAIESGENNAQSDNSMDAYGTNVKNFNVQLAVVEYDDNVDIIDTDD